VWKAHFHIILKAEGGSLRLSLFWPIIITMPGIDNSPAPLAQECNIV
jgi:hypothetical protein